ncbi:MAG: acetate--CoA ligase family protein [Burkholderiaceae bacterium]|nr:acetate--CoA ligase family protein [Burkholderiaceae bacterium]
MTTLNESPSASEGPIHIVDRVYGIEGYMYGLGQPALLLKISVQTGLVAREGPVSHAIEQQLELPSAPLELLTDTTILRKALRWAVALQVKSGLPVFDHAVWIRRAARVHTVALPCLTHASGLIALRGAIEMITRSIAFDRDPEKRSVQSLSVQLTSLISELARLAPRGFNTVHFLRAAHELGVPWSQVNDTVHQIGWGSRSRWLSSSFTDATPQISTMVARDKVKAAAILRAGGIPVPAHAAALNEDEAVSQAQMLGYPVVVKPVDLDGGVGVFANLESPESVRAAFFAARKLSRRVLVEKHIRGRDYRLQVVDEEVQGILERVPGGVTGDGVNSVAILLEQQNLARRTATDDRKYLKQMALDDEAGRMLVAVGLDATSVPASGQVVRLRAAANVASGGVPVPFEPALAHPDNLALAVRAARLLRLDVAGVDLLIPDIARSWIHTGAAICEVNAQPQMFTTLHKPMLRSLLGDGDGRIPVLVVLGASTAAEVAVNVHTRLDSPTCTAGLAEPEGVWISSRRITRGPIGLFQGARMLLRDRKVDAVVLSLPGERQFPASGWPVDRCDVLVLAAPAGTPNKAVAGAWIEAVRSLRPRTVVASAGAMHAVSQSGLRLPRGLEVKVVESIDTSGLVTASLDALLACEA